jgi:hypothetical protein
MKTRFLALKRLLHLPDLLLLYHSLLCLQPSVHATRRDEAQRNRPGLHKL